MKDFWEDSVGARAFTRGSAFVRALHGLALLAVTWCGAAGPAHACSLASPFAHATPESGETLPSGEVVVALHYYLGSGGGTFRVEDELGEVIPATVRLRGAATLLRFDSSSTSQVAVYGPDAFAQEALLATYEVSAETADTTPPSAPTVSVGQASCTACTEPHDSCCERPDTEGRLDTLVRFTPTQPGTIVGWVNGAGELAGILDPRVAYHSAPTFTGDARTPPASAPVVALSVAGVMSDPVTWVLVEQGACDAGTGPNPPDPDPTANGKGCSAAPSVPSRTSMWMVAAALLVLFRSGRRYAAGR